MEYKLGIYSDRIGVIIGRKGKVKKRLEEMTGVKINVDSKSNTVTVSGDKLDSILTAMNIIKAMNYGFSPGKAFKLLDPDYVLHIIDIFTYLRKKDDNNLRRVMGRIIGERGKTKKILEETTGADISIYRNFVAAIGFFDNILIFDEAIKKLVKGLPHRIVYEFLYNARSMRRMGLGAW